MIQCQHDPRETDIRRGSYTCPDCGWMVMAGCQHPKADEFAPVDTMTFDQARMR